MSLHEIMEGIQASKKKPKAETEEPKPKSPRIELEFTDEELRQARRYYGLTKEFTIPDYDLDNWEPPVIEGVVGIVDSLAQEHGACGSCHTFNSLDREQDTIYHQGKKLPNGEWRVKLVMVYYGKTYCKFCGSKL